MTVALDQMLCREENFFKVHQRKRVWCTRDPLATITTIIGELVVRKSEKEKRERARKK